MLRQSLVIALMAAAAGCASQQVNDQAQGGAGAQPDSSSAQAAAAGQGSAGQAGAQAAQAGAGQSATGSQAGGAANAPSAKRSVYYDYDRAIIKDEFKSVIESHGGYLASHSGATVTIEGNCDERGSREYNLALGQRRADSVKAKLKLLGVSEGQVETVSWGREKPKAKGHDEAAWAQNRRSDIVYTRAQ
jgi:peptidoglycan-associated lipoprotein